MNILIIVHHDPFEIYIVIIVINKGCSTWVPFYYISTDSDSTDSCLWAI